MRLYYCNGTFGCEPTQVLESLHNRWGSWSKAGECIARLVGNVIERLGGMVQHHRCGNNCILPALLQPPHRWLLPLQTIGASLLPMVTPTFACYILLNPGIRQCSFRLQRLWMSCQTGKVRLPCYIWRIWRKHQPAPVSEMVRCLREALVLVCVCVTDMAVALPAKYWQGKIYILWNLFTHPIVCVTSRVGGEHIASW